MVQLVDNVNRIIVLYLYCVVHCYNDDIQPLSKQNVGCRNYTYIVCIYFLFKHFDKNSNCNGRLYCNNDIKSLRTNATCLPMGWFFFLGYFLIYLFFLIFFFNYYQLVCLIKLYCRHLLSYLYSDIHVISTFKQSTPLINTNIFTIV